MNAITIDGVTKRYGDVLALEDLDLTVRTREVYGFIGPNGAGKSTTISILLDLVRPTAGTAHVLGLDAQSEQVSIRERVGVLPERSGLYGRLSGRELVAFALEAHASRARPMALLERVGLDDAGERLTGTYSKGMAQRLRLALALAGEPDLLILDEPASGLDPTGVSRLRQIVREERDRGAAVFFSTHSLEQVRAVCDRVGMIVDGTLQADDSIGILDEARTRVRLTVIENSVAIIRCLRGMPGVSVECVNGRVVECTLAAEIEVESMLGTVTSVGVLEGYEIEEESLEDAFVRIGGMAG